MATHPLNKQQMEAVSEFGANLLVTAGAGTGKTSVLTGKFLRLLEERRAEVDGIVAITFTNKAAAEMRERIRQAIQDHYLDASQNKKTDSGGESEFWKRQLLKMDCARICTFHSFCLGLIKGHPLQLGIPPVSGILDEGEESIYLNEAFEAMLTEYLNINTFPAWESQNKILLRILLDFGWNSFQNCLISSYQTIRESGISFTETVKSSIINLEKMINKVPYEIPHLINEIDDFLAFVKTISLTERAGEIIGYLRQNWPKLQNSLRSGQIQSQVLPCLSELTGLLPKNVPNSIKERVLALRDLIDALIQKLLDRESLIRLPVFGELLLKLDERYATIKRELGALDFTDQLIMARDLLRLNPDLATQIRQGIRYLLVDEFQDTNSLQMELADLLVGDTYQGGRFMAVGDIKQSIYRFRGADAGLILELGKRLDRQQGKIIPLTQNYRSHELIIQFVNNISATLFQNEPFPYEPLEAVARSRGSEQDARIEFILTGTPDRTIEASMVARHIQDMVNQSAEEGGSSPVRYGDIVLLFRVKTGMPIYQQALRELGIPHYVAGISGFYNCQEVIDQLNLLRVVEQRYDGVALFGLLTSPFVGISDESLLWLGQGKNLMEQFYQNDDYVIQITPAERKRLKKFRDLLFYLQERREFLNIPDIIRIALDHCHYREMLWTMPNAAQRLANLDKLLAKADDFVAKGFHDLRHFLMYIEKLEGAGVLEGEAPTEAEAGNTVRLMTIHSAKGLEFPVVFLPDLDRQFPRSVSSKVTYHKTVGLGFSIPFGDEETGYSSTWRQIKELHKKEEISELKRLLYVAMTRAKRHLIMAGSGCNKSQAKEIETANNWMKWFQLILPLSQSAPVINYAGVPIKIIRELPSVNKPGRGFNILDEFSADLPNNNGELLTETGDEMINTSRNYNYQGFMGYKEVAATAAPPCNVLVNLKVSEILAFKNCGRRYYWRYKARLDDSLLGFGGATEKAHEQTGDYLGARIGNFLHQAIQTAPLFALETSVAGGGISLDNPGWADTLWQKIFPDISGPEADRLKRDLESIWSNFRNSPFAVSSGEYWDEVPFQIKLPEAIIVEGRFDRLIKNEAGELILVDFKTHRAGAEKVKRIAESYFWQVQIYALAVEALWGSLPRQAVLYFPYSDVTVSAPLERELLNQTVAEVMEIAEFTVKHDNLRDFPYQRDEECNSCGYCGLCDKIMV